MGLHCLWFCLGPFLSAWSIFKPWCSSKKLSTWTYGIARLETARAGLYEKEIAKRLSDMDWLNIYIVILQVIYNIYLIKAAQLPGKSFVGVLIELSLSGNLSFENPILLWRILSQNTISLWFACIFRHMFFHSCQDRFRRPAQVLLGRVYNYSYLVTYTAFFAFF